MSKFTRIINTFKNGLVSTRLRGSISDPSDSSSAEVLENFMVDRTGSIYKRPGTQLLSSKTYAAGTQYFNANFLGNNYRISIDPNQYFNSVDSQYSSTSILINEGEQATKVFGTGKAATCIVAWDHIGTAISLLVPSGHGFVAGNTIIVSGLVNSSTPNNTPNGKYVITSVDPTHINYTSLAIPSGSNTVNVDGGYVTLYSANGNSTDLYMWNGRYNTSTGAFIDSGLSNYLHASLYISQFKNISERTVVFTCTNGFSFLISLLDYSTDALTIRKFIIYPYFVSTVMLLNTLGKYFGDTVSCPITPSNFPFNPINTNTLFIPTVAVQATQSGSTPVAGIVTKSTQEICCNVSFPLSIAQLAGGSYGLVGRFVSIPSAATTEDVIFFITGIIATTSTVEIYSAIQCIGGVVSTVSSAWKISSWGDTNHPKVCGFAFGRLMYANTSANPSTWWSAAVHPNNIFYRQGFMTKNLLQDSNSDFSGINYQGVTISSISTPSLRTDISDIYRFGFYDVVPSLGNISWIASRRVIHIGTSNGENQLTVPGGNYSSATYSQMAFGTNSSPVAMSTDGDRKIFFLSKDGKDIRVIITEDKDFDSLDNLVTLALTGLNLIFTKIEWIDELHGLLCLTNTKRLFFLSSNSDTKIQAFSELVFTKEILGFSGLRIFLKDGSTELTTILNTDLTVGGLFPTALPIHADIYSYNIGALPDFSNYYSKSIKIVIISNDKVYTYYDFDVPSGPFLVSLLPFDSSLLTDETVYIYTDSMTTKLKTLPIHEGAKFGSSVGDIQRVDRITVLVDNSGPFKYGPDEDNLMEVEGVVSGDTKLVSIDFPQSPDKEIHVYIESSDPTPLNISGISLRGVSYSGE